MPNNTVNGFTVNGQNIKYNYDALENRLLKSSISEEYDSTRTYNVGDYVLYEGQLYKCKVDISTAESFNVVHWDTASIVTEFSTKDYINGKLSSWQDISDALENIFKQVTYKVNNGSEYIDNLVEALNAANPVTYIIATFEQGSAIIYDADTLDSLRQYLTVTVYYLDGTYKDKTTYSLSGTLNPGVDTITVSYGGKTTTFDVTVTRLIPIGYNYVTAISAAQLNQSGYNAVQYSKLGFAAVVTKKYRVTTEIKWMATQTATSVVPQMMFSGCMLICNNGGYYSNFISSATPINIPCSTTDFDVIEMIADNPNLSYSYSINGVGATITRQSAPSPRESCIFASVPNTTQYVATGGCACSIKRTKIYEDDVLIMDLVPCINDSNSKPGFYDVVNSNFYPSQSNVDYTYIP